jgi:hypothetical protein
VNGRTSRSPSGAPLSNTAPANSISDGEGSFILRTGVDSLYLSYRGELHTARDYELSHLKSLAQSFRPDEQSQAVLELLGHRFEVKDKGQGRFPYVLDDNWFRVALSRPTATSMPLAYCQVGSELLTQAGAEKAAIALGLVVTELGEVEPPSTVSRVDLCVDFVTDVEFKSLDQASWVTRSDRQHLHFDKGRFSGLTFGLGGDISCRLYDKTLEIARSGKTWLYPLWTAAGWDGQRTVWRLEFQFRSGVLRDLGIRTVEALLEHQGGVWAYATRQWLRLTLPNAEDGTKARWPTHPLWDLLAAAPWGPGPHLPLSRVRKSRIPSDERLFIHGLGPITSFMAREGLHDIDRAILHFKDQAKAFYRERETQRTQEGGWKKIRTLQTYAREKAEMKARRYNTLVDSKRPLTEAERYRQARDGE